jgi:anaerobic selenocysteine-containing dehydrogenase
MPSVRNSVCALDCPDTCSLLINVDEAGRGSKLRGNPDHPVTRGFLCGKVARYLEREYHPDRLFYPLRRVGAKGSATSETQWVRIGWEEALDTIASRLGRISEEFGPEAILPYSYAGTMGILQGSSMDRRLFHRLGASRLDRTICSAAGGAALMLSQGAKLGTEPEQFAHAKLIIAWGANVLGTNVHLWPFIVEARRRGAKFWVIDPIKNRTGHAADRHFAINPGSDLALAHGLAHIILKNSWHDRSYVEAHTAGFAEFEKLVSSYTPERVSEWTGLCTCEIEEIARTYAQTMPAVIRVNYGIQRSERGGAAVRAVAALPVLTGHWRNSGGGLQLSTSGAFQFNRASLERPDLQKLSPLGREARLINMTELGDELLEREAPPIKALVVYNSNPAAIAPNSARVVAGLKRSDLFTVVLEHFLTDTADYADIVLPVTTFLEHTDLYLAYGHYYLQMARPALPAPGETKSNVEIFRLLAKRLGFADSCFEDSEDDMIRQALSTSSSFLRGITLEQLEREHSVRLRVSEQGIPFLPFAEGGFGTPSAKFEFGAEALSYEPAAESRFGNADLKRKYPLELISSKNDDSMNSTFGNRAEVQAQTAIAELNPQDATARGIGNGDSIRLRNDRGQYFCEARIVDHAKPGVVRVPSTRWAKTAPGEMGVNQLTSSRLTDIGGGATFYSCLVEAELARPQTSR